MSEPIEILVSDVVFRADLYPRLEKSPDTVTKYAADLEVLPPIEVNQRNELIDGWHRWTAHKTAKRDKIFVVVTPTMSDAELLLLACARNSTHGLQLSQADKEDMAHRIYLGTPEREREQVKASLARSLAVSDRSIRAWLSRIDKETKDKRNRRILAAWMACDSEDTIAEREGLTQQSVNLILQETATLPKLVESPAATYADAFADPSDHEDKRPKRPIYNVWKQQTKSEGNDHFGNSEINFVDNLLYLYTKPLDVVVDPFAGGGSTINLCKKRLRRYFVSDRLPTREDVRTHDVTAGLPPLHKGLWKDVSLVYLDPPYWKQAAGEYSTDPADLANMTADDFHAALGAVINDFAEKLHAGAKIALIIQPTQWKADDRAHPVDHIVEMILRANKKKLLLKLRISAPYESQQCNAQMVTWAKDNREVLVLSREIVVWEVA